MNATKLAGAIFRFLVVLLIIFAPSNLFLNLCHGCGYVNGLESDYLLPKLYLVDLVMLLLVGWGIWLWRPVVNLKSVTNLKNLWPTSKKVALALVLILAVRQIWTPFSLASLWTLCQWILVISAGWTLHKAYQKKIVLPSTIAIGLTLGLFLQVVVASYQLVTQKPLFNYHVLGETDIRRTVGITLTDFANQQVVAPYGTTAHPNVLAGFLAVYSLLLVEWLLHSKLNKKIKVLPILTLVASLFVLGSTSSTSGAAILVSGGLVSWLGHTHFLKKISVFSWRKVLFLVIAGIMVIGIATTWLPDTSLSIYRRQYLLKTSWAMIQSNWLWGSGLSNFTALSEQYSQTTEIVRFNQPVHHVGWLWLAETGLLGLGILTVLFCFTINSKTRVKALVVTLVVLAPVIVWDHYLISLESGRVLLLVFAFLPKINQGN